jgi:predicted Holliday junction resolvase-like endonuclease
MVIFLVTLLVMAACVAHLSYKAGRKTGEGVANEEVGRLKAEKRVVEGASEAVQFDWIRDKKRIDVLEADLKKIKSQKKSSEVRTGLIAEQMAPFLEGFPYDPRSAVFLGKPLDFVVFDEEGIHFVEVKSGNAQLTTKQRMLRDLINDKKVTFEVYSIKGE